MNTFAIIVIVYCALGIGLIGGLLLALWGLEKCGTIPKGEFSKCIHESFSSFRETVRTLWQTMLWPIYVILIIIWYWGAQ